MQVTELQAQERLIHFRERDYLVTPEKVDEAVRRIVDAADPLQVILFGSWARGENREDSDLDIAVVIDASDAEARRRLPYSVLRGLRMEIDMVVVSKERFDRFRPWLNSVFNYIDKEGIVLYDREHPESANPDALRARAGRRRCVEVPAA